MDDDGDYDDDDDYAYDYDGNDGDGDEYDKILRNFTKAPISIHQYPWVLVDAGGASPQHPPAPTIFKNPAFL